MKIKFPISVMYGQVLVHRQGLPRPGLLWTDDHVAQGFAWEEEIVAFGVPDHDGECLLDIDSEKQAVSVAGDALWAISVPFSVTTGKVDVGTVMVLQKVDLPLGDYELVFQAFDGSGIEDGRFAYRITLDFISNDQAEFAILKKGGELTTDKVLSRTAQRA